MIDLVRRLFRRRVDGMHAFYANALLRSLMFAMTGIFTPLYVYRVMLPVVGTVPLAIMTIAGFYILARAVSMLTNIPAARIIEKIGFRKSVLVSVLILLVYLIALIAGEGNYFYLIISAILLGMQIPFYWVARLSVVSMESKSNKIGEEISLMMVMERISGIAGPVAAGLIIKIWGFGTLYTFAGIILAASVLPLLNMPHHLHRNGVSLKGLYLWLTDSRFYHQAVSAVARAFDDLGFNVVWPVVLFFMGIHYETLGLFYSILTVLTIAVRFGSGKIFDWLYRKRGLEDEIVYGVAAVGSAITWIIRLFVRGISSALMVDGGMMIFATTYRSISDDYTALGGKRMHEIAYFTYREMVYSLAAIFYGGLWIVGAYYGVWKELLFLTTAVWTLASVVQGRESNLK